MTRNKIVVILLLSLSFVTACQANKNNPFVSSDEYIETKRYLDQHGIQYREILDYVFIQYQEDTMVIKRSDDYRYIQKLRVIPYVKYDRKNTAKIIPGMTPYQVVEILGCPILNPSMLSLPENYLLYPRDQYTMPILFRADLTHLNVTL